MKIFLLSLMLGLGMLAECAYAEDGDHSVRPRPEHDPLQQDILVTRRVQLYATDMKGVQPSVTTDFGKRGFVNLAESAEPEVYFAP